MYGLQITIQTKELDQNALRVLPNKELFKMYLHKLNSATKGPSHTKSVQIPVRKIKGIE